MPTAGRHIVTTAVVLKVNLIVYISGSHVIRRDEFRAYFSLTETPLTIKIVKMMDTTKHGCLNFCEMVGLMWDFLSRDPNTLGSFAFSLIDRDLTGTMSRDEVIHLIELLHNSTAAKHKGVRKIITDLEGKMNRNEIDVDTFQNYCHQHNNVCASLFTLQNSFREKMLGRASWENIGRRRQADKQQMEQCYIQRLFATMKKNEKLKAYAEVRIDTIVCDFLAHFSKYTSLIYLNTSITGEISEKLEEKIQSIASA